MEAESAGAKFCQNCKKEIPFVRGGNRRKYCSKSCNREFDRKKEKEKKLANKAVWTIDDLGAQATERNRRQALVDKLELELIKKEAEEAEEALKPKRLMPKHYIAGSLAEAEALEPEGGQAWGGY